MTNEALKQIIERANNSDGVYLEIFAADDTKKTINIKNKCFKISETKFDDLLKLIETNNKQPLGCFINFNPLNAPKRLKKNIININYIFIDLDDAEEDHNKIIIENLKKMNISYSYNAKSGHGYHFLIPISLKPEKEINVKQFLTYLKHKICDKVDIATYTNERLLRIPLSNHYKDNISKPLITLHNHIPTDAEIKSNSKYILEYQVDLLSKKSKEYSKEIIKKDLFFSELLKNTPNWSIYIDILRRSKDRNQKFVKNLAFFVLQNKDYDLIAKDFLNKWEIARVSAFEGWKKKKGNTNYLELYKWAKENNINLWLKILKKQITPTFLDKYEFYYLEDEKKESAYLMYYPDKNYYVQKSLNEVLQNVVYDATESGIDLANELYLTLLEDWEEFSFKKQQALIISTLYKRIREENRLKLVFNLNYSPIDEKFIYHKSKKYFNTYNQTELWNHFHKTKKEYNFPCIKDLILNLVGDDETSFNWFCNWLGWVIQHPEEKLPTAVIFQGQQGSGKGTFKTHILDNIFGDNCQEINQTHLESAFNEYLLGKQIIVANEVMHTENKQTLPNILKNLVTDPEITISRKFKKEITGKNYTHWIFCTNSDNPIKIDEDDRRYTVFKSKKLKGGGANAVKFVQNLRKNLEFELKEFISYLKSLNIEYKDVHEPLMTDAKSEIIDLNKDSIDKFIEYLQQYKNISEVYFLLFGHLNDYTETSFDDGKKYIITDKIYSIYQRWCTTFQEKGVFSKQNFNKRLSNNDCKSLVKWRDGRTFRMFDVEVLNNKLVNKLENDKHN